MSDFQKNRKFPYEIIADVKDNLDGKKKYAVLDKETQTTETKVVFCGPNKILQPNVFKKYCWDLYNFQPRSDDVWLFGYPRSGTTLTQEILWLIGNDLDYKRSFEDVLDIRFPIIHNEIHMDREMLKKLSVKSRDNSILEVTEKFNKVHLQQLNQMKEKRFLKSHLPPSLLSPKLLSSDAKIVFIIRNPKDTIVSNFHMLKFFSINESQLLTFREFFHLFTSNSVLYNPFFAHIKEYWALRHRKNTLLLFYEEIRKDLRATLIKVSKFMNKKLSEKDFDDLQCHLSLESFKSNKSVNNDYLIDIGIARKNQQHEFIRKGKVGGWQEYFTDDLNEQANKWIEENLKGIDIVFPGI